MPRLLTVCGSLQSASANRAALDAASAVAMRSAATVDDFDHLAEIPAFDPHLEGRDRRAADEWRERVARADALLVAAPEYAGGVAGAVKNAFDWLVGTGELYRKPVAVMSAGTSGGEHARPDLARTLTWQGAYVVAELGIPAPRTKSDPEGRITDEPTLAAMASLTDVLQASLSMSGADVVARAEHVVGRLGIDLAHVAPAELGPYSPA